MSARNGTTVAISLLLVALGAVAIGRTFAAGVGGGLGLLLGGLMILAGVGRLALLRMRS